MSDPEKKIIVDDDWKAEAQREKERLASEVEQKKPDAEGVPVTPFLELLNLLAMQAMVGLGGFAGPDGRPIPANLEAAKHFIDLLQVLEEKTKGNLTEEETKVLDQTLYELRMRFVQLASAAGGPGGAGGPAGDTPSPSEPSA